MPWEDWDKDRVERNIHLDLWKIVQDEIHAFVKREPNQVKDIDWDTLNSSYAFSRGANLTSKAIQEYLVQNKGLILRYLSNTGAETDQNLK